jgi:hypothetical protein
MDDAEPLGEVLAKALDASEARVYAQPQVSSITLERKAATTPNLFTLAKSENAASYIAARRQEVAPRKR